MDWLKKGDKVRMTRNHGTLSAGDIVTIEAVDKDDKQMPYLVTGGYWLDNGTFEPADTKKAKFEVGQIYRVEESLHDEDWSGSIFKISNMESDDIYTKAIRGNRPSFFQKGSTFGNNLTLLTGKEIGEAIRKWGADHAKKPEPEYNEVKRQAKVGDVVRLINNGSAYTAGEICKVIANSSCGNVYIRTKKKSYFNGDAADHHIEQPFSYIAPNDYVVLTPSVKEVKRIAKKGEYVKIVNAHDTQGNYKNGSVLKIVGDSTIIGGTRYGINAGEFLENDEHVVLEGYKPEQNGKHSYTAEQIADAKKLCGEMMLEALSDGNAFTLRFLDKNYHEASKTVECNIERFNGAKNSTGTAKCADHDEYNVWIGRCVALCKALHKPIPKFIMGDGKGKHFDLEKAKRLTDCPSYDAVIHVANEKEQAELMQELETLGFTWAHGDKPTKWNPEDFDMTFAVGKNCIYFNRPYDCSKVAEFSDCFTGD